MIVSRPLNARQFLVLAAVIGLLLVAVMPATKTLPRPNSSGERGFYSYVPHHLFQKP